MSRFEKHKYLVLMIVAVLLNIIGSKIAQILILPIYLDQLGTLLVARQLGYKAGLTVATVGAWINFILGDSYALYFLPVALTLAVACTFSYRHCQSLNWKILSYVFQILLISLPASLVAASLVVYLFGGFTLAGSSLLVVYLASHGMAVWLAAFLVQIVTDLLDRAISLLIVVSIERGINAAL